MEFNFTLPADFLTKSPHTDLKLPAGYTRVVLHSCCAPCSTAVLECLLQNKIKPVVFFFNPNIHPQDEYLKRRDEWLHLCELLKVETVIGDYEPRCFFEATRGFEQEKERGQRCDLCFKLRLVETAKLAVKLNIGLFTTTLCTSRWKSKPQVNGAGFAAEKAVIGSKFWDFDWRKGGMITRRYQLVKEIGYYNQQYCGCVYSLRQRQMEDELKAKLHNSDDTQAQPQRELKALDPA